MNKKMFFVLVFLPLFLSSCFGSVDELYYVNQYNSSDFMKNYYVHDVPAIKNNVRVKNEYNVGEYLHVGDNLDGLRPTDRQNYKFDGLSADQYGYAKALSKVDSSFSYGYLSKLYDGRVRCDGYYALSRLQLDKQGYTTIFPKELNSYHLFAFAARGGTDCERTFSTFPTIEMCITFYSYDYNDNIYDAYVFNTGEFQLITNAGGGTYFVNFYFDEVMGASYQTIMNRVKAMSLTFSLKESIYDDLSDDMTKEGVGHFALMLYEVMLPDSTWN